MVLTKRSAASGDENASRNKVDVDMFHKNIQYALEKLGKSKFGFERTVVSKFKRKRRVGSGNELVDYSRAPCLGADQKAPGLWERDCSLHVSLVVSLPRYTIATLSRRGHAYFMVTLRGVICPKFDPNNTSITGEINRVCVLQETTKQ